MALSTHWSPVLSNSLANSTDGCAFAARGPPVDDFEVGGIGRRATISAAANTATPNFFIDLSSQRLLVADATGSVASLAAAS